MHGPLLCDCPLMLIAVARMRVDAGHTLAHRKSADCTGHGALCAVVCGPSVVRPVSSVAQPRSPVVASVAVSTAVLGPRELMT